MRLISATNRDLEAAVEAGTFRKDLYYRLKIVTVKLPPLRERREDIPLLTAHFLKEFAARHGKNVQRVSDVVRKAMAAYDWPGNVRELRNLIESMVVQDSDGVLDMDDIQEGESLRRVPGSDGQAVGAAGLVGRPLAEVERYYCERALELTQGKREDAARMLGIGERTLYRMMQDWKVQDRIREALGETGGNVEEAAKKLDMKPEALGSEAEKTRRSRGGEVTTRGTQGSQTQSFVIFVLLFVVRGNSWRRIQQLPPLGRQQDRRRRGHRTRPPASSRNCSKTPSMPAPVASMSRSSRAASS